MVMFWKFLGEMCLYFSVITALPHLFVRTFNPLYIISLCTLAVSVKELAGLKHNPALRYLGLIPAVASLFFIRSGIDALIIIPVAVYTILIVVMDLKSPDYHNSRLIFVISFTLWTIIAAAMLSFDYFIQIVENRVSVNHIALLVLGAAFLFCESIILRKLRINTPVTLKKDSAVTTRYFAAITGSGFIFCSLFTGFIWLLRRMTGLLLDLTALALVIPKELSEAMLNFANQSKPAAKQLNEIVEAFDSPPVAVPAGQTLDEIGQLIPETVETTFPWWLLICLAAVLVFILYLFISRNSLTEEETASETPIETYSPPKPAVRKFEGFGNREKVRRIYRSFLKLAVNRGYKASVSDTSAQIQDKTSEFTDKESSERLRNIYLEARYNENCKITGDMVDEAGRALNTVIK